MKTKGVFKGIMVLLVFLPAMAGCSKEEPVIADYPELPLMIGSQGGIVKGFNGDVVLTIPAGAVSQGTRFVIHEWLNKSTLTDCELLRTFVIEPYVTFNLPVKLTVNCQGSLATDVTLCDKMEVFFFIWDNPSDFCMQSGHCTSSCFIDMGSKTISATINQTGILATVAKIL